MSKFNLKLPMPIEGRYPSDNRAGGKAFELGPKERLTFLVLTSLLKNQFYRSSGETLRELIQLLGQVDQEYSAKLSLYARNVFGLRSISHAISAWLAIHASGKPWLTSYFIQAFRRPDDMTETVAAYQAFYQRRPLPNALKRAIRARLTSFSDYSLAKYRSEGKAVKLVDLVNLTHPKSTRAIDELIKGTLKPADTWETGLTQAGQKGGDKAEVWQRLLAEKKLGYLALLRNLRNIIEQAPDMWGTASEMLTDPDRIKKSLVLPHQFAEALKAMRQTPNSAAVTFLDTAMDIAMENVPVFEGKTLVALDISGSMSSVQDLAGLFAAAILKRNPHAHLIRFESTAEYYAYNPFSTFTDLAEQITDSRGGTNFLSVLDLIFVKEIKYDRIIFISDMQGWMGQLEEAEQVVRLRKYERLIGKPVSVYSFDVAGYGTVQFPLERIYAFAGISEKVFDIIGLLESDRQALIKLIEGYSLMTTTTKEE